MIVINTGATANDGTGDKLRDAFIIVNQNFNEIDNLLNGTDVLTISQITGLQTALTNINNQLVYIPILQADVISINSTIYTINQTLNSQNSSISDLYSDITNLQNQIYNKIDEAPIDGNQYVRQDGAWESITIIQGATGATGPQGIQGIQGATGPSGDTSLLVPYIGAINDVNLDSFGITASYFGFTGLTNSGRLSWNDADGTADLTLKGGNVTLQIGQENIIRVVNKTGSNLLEENYQVVRVRTQAEGGAAGQRLAVKLAQANSNENHSGVLGLVTETINNNQEGFITIFGNINKVNTTGSLQGETWIDGDTLWLSETVAGGLTNIEPTSHPVKMGYVVYSHSNNGKIFVKVDEGVDELHELHDVRITGATNSQLLSYEDGLWINKDDNSIQKSIGSTYTTNTVLTVTQAEYDAIVTKDPATLYFIV